MRGSCLLSMVPDIEADATPYQWWMNQRGLVAMVITEHKKMEACKLVVMGADREQIHEMRIAMMAALEGLKEGATNDGRPRHR